MQIRSLRNITCLVLLWTLAVFTVPARGADPSSPTELYQQLKAFKLGQSSVKVQDFALTRDAIQMVFTGDLYFTEPTAGGVYGAVFLGQGRLKADPKLSTESESIKRFLNTTTVESTFTKAVLRFTDDTYQKFAGQPSSGAAPAEAQRLASSVEEHLTRETGMNLSARVLLAIMNKDNPGVFYAELDGGDHGRLSVVLDHQGRIPSDVFEINGGEKGMIFKYAGIQYGNDVWTAFFDQQDFDRGMARYSDAFDIVSIPLYKLDIDLKDPGNWLRMRADMELVALSDNIQMIPMQLNQGLDEADNERRNKGVRVLSAETADGKPVAVIQEEWESGVSLILPTALAKGQSVHVILKMEGKDSLWSWGSQFHYPRSTTSWYPRHGYLTRSRFQITYHHDKTDRVASIGERVREGAGEGGEWVTEWAVNDPVALVTFVCGPFQRHAENVDVGGKPMPIEYYSPPGNIQAVKEDFILAEMGNAVRYFDNLFGQYPYKRIGGAYFPTGFGQGFPTLLLLPVEGTADRYEYAFMAHENAHQWWGNLVGWRSYRDQWLSEGFAEYSGVLYTRLRSNAKDASELIKEMRREMIEIPKTSTGVANVKLHEIGPLILGYRLNSSRSRGAAQLMYSKGALVLRMLHYLLSDPQTGDDKAFFAMMKDFVDRHRNGLATTESFIQVAGEHFARSPIGQKYGLKDLNWFLFQWVYQTGLPSYEFDYKIEPRDGGGFLVKGTVLQQGVGDNFFMALPLVAEFSGGRVARTVINAIGPKTTVQIGLPEKPQKLRLDPDLWILSEKTSEKAE